jgi:hypothetical protein
VNRLRQLLFEHNPFYLLSALSMLFGCYTLSNALRMEAGQSWKVLVLLGTLHVYEFLLIGLALFLIRQRAMPRDGGILLRLEVLFLVDATLLNAEAFTANVATGALVNGACLALAALKLGLILKTLGARLGRLGSAAYGHGLALVVAVPGAFALLGRTRALSAATVYAAWWPLGLLIVFLAASRSGLERTDPGARAFLDTLAVALPASVGAHLLASGWVHQLGFHVSYLGPVLIGLGVARMLVDVSWIDSKARFLLPVAGVVLSLGAPAELTTHGPLGIALSPLREALFFAGLGYLVGWRLLGEQTFAVAALLSLMFCMAGHSVSAFGSTLGSILRALRSGGGSLFPRTLVGWGMLAVGSAFALLGMGAWVSLFKGAGERARPPARR